MQLVLMIGLPKSGKTLISKVLHSILPGSDVVRPSDWLPSNINSLPTATATDYKITAWDMSIEQVNEFISENNGNTLILDQCNSRVAPLCKMIGDCRQAGGKVIGIYVNSTKQACVERGADKNLVEQYASELIKSISSYQKITNKLFIIDNSGPIENLKEKLREVKNYICQNI